MIRTRELLESGWVPPPPRDAGIESDARARMRLRFWPIGGIRGTKPIAAPGTEIDAAGCFATSGEGGVVRAVVTGPGTIELTAPLGTAINVAWEDEFGTASRDVPIDDRFGAGAFLTLTRPLTTAELTIAGEAVTICGLAAG